MTDQIPADKVRAWVTSWETTRPEHRTLEDAEGIIQALRDMLPTPPRPTLADMTDDERAECQRMQCDVGGEDARAVIIHPHWENGSASVLWSGGFFTYPDWEQVTPRPDLPRLEWSGTEKPAPAPAPPNTLTEGSEWDNVDALARACEESGRDQIVVADKDGEVFVWGADAGWWETGLPGCDYAPHTILHTGRKDDQ